MHLSGLYQEARMLNANPDFYNSDDWMVVPYPVFEGGKDLAACYYFQYYMVNSQATPAEQKEAWKFVYFLLSHAETYLKTVQLVQPTKSLLESETYKNMPFSDVFEADLDRANVVYYGAASLQINELIKEAVESVMMKNTTPEEAVAKLKKSAKHFG